MYYLRTKAATDAIKFSIDKTELAAGVQTQMENRLQELESVKVTNATFYERKASQNLNTINYQVRQDTPIKQEAIVEEDITSYEQKMSDMSCSLDDPDGCEACGS